MQTRLTLIVAATVLLPTLPAFAQHDDWPRQKMLGSSVARQQQSEAFALQLRQQQQLLQRQQFDNFNEQQQTSLRSSQAGGAAAWGPRLETRALRMELDRRLLLDHAQQQPLPR